MAQFAIPRSTSSRWSRPCGGSWTWGETCITNLSDVDFCGRDDFDPWWSRETFGHDTDECPYMLTGLVWSKRLVIVPLLDEYHEILRSRMCRQVSETSDRRLSWAKARGTYEPLRRKRSMKESAWRALNPIGLWRNQIVDS